MNCSRWRSENWTASPKFSKKANSQSFCSPHGENSGLYTRLQPIILEKTTLTISSSVLTKNVFLVSVSCVRNAIKRVHDKTKPFIAPRLKGEGRQNAIDYHTHHNCNHSCGRSGFMAVWRTLEAFALLDLEVYA